MSLPLWKKQAVLQKIFRFERAAVLDLGISNMSVFTCTLNMRMCTQGSSDFSFSISYHAVKLLALYTLIYVQPW